MTDGRPNALNKALFVSLALVAAMAAAALYGWLALPSDARVPIHWGLDGEPDRFAGRTVALGMVPVLALLISIGMAALPALDPRRANLLRSSKAYVVIWVTLIGFMALVQVGIVGTALGYAVDIPTIIGVGLGILLMVIGNFLGKVRSNFFLGIRTPWTLSSDRVWHRTHRMAGPLFVLLGAATLLAALTVSPEAFAVFLLVAAFAVVAFIVGYSYVLWRQEQGAAGGAGGNAPTIQQ